MTGAPPDGAGGAAAPGAGTPPPEGAQALHASCVAVDGRGVLLLGPSGAGKSGLALQLMALGAELVADDRTLVARLGGALFASAPPAGFGLIEARGVGILRVPARPVARLALAVDLGRPETARLPPPRRLPLLGLELPLLQKVESAHFAAAVLHYLRGSGRED